MKNGQITLQESHCEGNMKKGLLVLLVIVWVFSFSGCATIFTGDSEKVSFVSDPAGAEVYVDGTLRGKTPVTIDLDKSRMYAVEVRKEGYESQFATIKSKVGLGWVALDVFSGLAPLIVDAATGSWKYLSPNELSVPLVK
jgi:uncharacterized protein YceK